MYLPDIESSLPLHRKSVIRRRRRIGLHSVTWPWKSLKAAERSKFVDHLSSKAWKEEVFCRVFFCVFTAGAAVHDSSRQQNKHSQVLTSCMDKMHGRKGNCSLSLHESLYRRGHVCFGAHHERSHDSMQQDKQLIH